jgi:hypothetical protein
LQGNKLSSEDLIRALSGCPAALPDEKSVDRCQMWKLDKMPQRIYIAASINAVALAAKLWMDLEIAGFKIASSWIALDHEKLKKLAAESREDYIRIHRQMGERDFEDLTVSDTLIVLTDVPSTSGGLHVELGFYLGAKRKNIIVVGPRPNVFFWHPTIRWTPAVDGLVEWLRRPEHGT